RQGLFPFEARAIECYFPPPPARLFVPGAGAGRELLALRARGYLVHGLEPVPALRQAAERFLPPLRSKSIQEGARAPEGCFDGIVVGWCLWGHLTAQADRLAVLEAFRKVCPNGPVLLSFFHHSAFYDPLECAESALNLRPVPEGRLRNFTRKLLREQML